jgi:hypothetical protein
VNAIKKDPRQPILERVKKTGVLSISKAIKKPEGDRFSQVKVFLRNLPDSVDSQEIKNMAAKENFGM